MSEKKPETDDLRKILFALADDLNYLVIREHQLLQTELDQTVVLVKDAVATLRVNFVNLSQYTDEQAEICTQSIDDGNTNEVLSQRTLELKHKINTSTMTSVRALQFEDIVQQLTGHARNRAVKMEQLFDRLSQKIAELKISDTQHADVFIQAIESMQKEIAEFREALEKENPVKQHTMQAGEIELF